MKKITLVFLTLVFGFQFSKAQTSSMIVDWKLWSTVDDYYHLISGGNTAPETYYVKFDQDTVIDFVAYKKILRSDDVYAEEFTCIGFASEDLVNQKVFYRNLEGDEGCVYDFSAVQGDTLTDLFNPLHPFLYYEEYDVLVDTVYEIMIDGSPRKVFELIALLDGDVIGDIEKVIEGVGSEFGVLETGYGYSGVVGWHMRNLCYWENDMLIWHDDAYDYCFFDDASMLNETQSNNLKIYPNPSDDVIHFQLRKKSASPVSLSVYSLQGELLLNRNGYFEQHTINLADFSAGMYIYTLTVDGKTFKGKLVFK